jgi:citrate lyase subunit beta / citryl-CoA lyase
MSDTQVRAASVGPLGSSVRSDLNVAYSPGDGALVVSVASKVDYLYRDAIEAATRRVAAAFGVETGSLAVTDAGALEWVILARLETCLRRAGFSGPPVLPQPDPSSGAPRHRERLRRSRLYLPGNQPKLMISAGLHGADALILDLEDSVPPQEKDAARYLVRNALVALDFGGSERTVRVNQGALGEADLEALVPHNLHLALLPKVEEAAEVARVAGLLRALAGDAEPPLLMPILESPRGVFNALAIATSDPLVAALTLGLEDLSAELGAPRTADGAESFLARQTVVYAARAAGVPPIASVYSDVADEEGLAAYVRRERSLGFDGIGCIHPRQIDVVHREMTPSRTEIERAIKVVRAAKEAEAQGLGVVAVGSKMVDPPVVKQAFRTVALGVAAGVLAPGWEETP